METTYFIGKDKKKHSIVTQFYKIGTYVIIDGKSETQGNSSLSEAQIHLKIRKAQEWFPKESSDIPEKPKEVKSVWDNNGKTIDRYTIVLKSHYTLDKNTFEAFGMSLNPTDPSSGFSQFTEATPGEHLGKRIQFYALPLHVIRHVVDRLKPETNPLSDLEQKAIAVSSDTMALRKRLDEAVSVMKDKSIFKNAIFDFENKRLITREGKWILQWKIRKYPDKPISYENQQTSVGTVVVTEILKGE